MIDSAYVPLGTFDLGATAILTDPCYAPHESEYLQVHVPDVAPGLWEASALFTEHEGARHVARLLAHHVDHRTHRDGHWREISTRASVDSGQTGIFDADSFPGGQERNWYERCRAITGSERRASVLDRGCVSLAAPGDGAYACHAAMDGDRVVALAIDFLPLVPTVDMSARAAAALLLEALAIDVADCRPPSGEPAPRSLARCSANAICSACWFASTGKKLATGDRVGRPFADAVCNAPALAALDDLLEARGRALDAVDATTLSRTQGAAPAVDWIAAGLHTMVPGLSLPGATLLARVLVVGAVEIVEPGDLGFVRGQCVLASTFFSGNERIAERQGRFGIADSRVCSARTIVALGTHPR